MYKYKFNLVLLLTVVCFLNTKYSYGFSATSLESNSNHLHPKIQLEKITLNQAPEMTPSASSEAEKKGNKQTGASSAVVAANPTVKSFKEWKNEKVQSAIKKVTITKAQIEYRKLNNQIFKKTEATAGREADIEKLEEQLKNDLFSLQIAQQLTVQDYFAIYLTKLENRNDTFKAAAQKMSSEDVEALIRVFADSLIETQGPKTAPSANAESIYDKIK